MMSKRQGSPAEAGYPDGFELPRHTRYDPHRSSRSSCRPNTQIGVKVTSTSSPSTSGTQGYQEEFRGDAAGAREPPRHRVYGNPDSNWGYNTRRGEAGRRRGSCRQRRGQTAKLLEATKIIAEDAASNWLYLYPQIVVSASGSPAIRSTAQLAIFAYGIQKAN